MTDATNSTSPWPDDFIAQQDLRSEASGDTAYTLLADMDLPESVARHLCGVYWPLAQLLARQMSARSEPLILGINGAQGTGKSTGAQILAHLLEAQGWRVCNLSIDDFYLSRNRRQQLARECHPLLATRGVPGTHDVGLGMDLLDSLSSAKPGSRTAIPRFDKALDDCKPRAEWENFTGRPGLIIFEGWCVGARPQPDALMTSPCNSLERLEDSDGRWRQYVNRQLEAYQPLFKRLDLLVMLQAPSFQQVYEWRALQEEKLSKGLSDAQLAESKVMTPAQLVRFISHYERLTRWILTEMPSRADVVMTLDREHRVNGVLVNRSF